MSLNNVCQDIFEDIKANIIIDMPLFAGALNVLAERENEGLYTFLTDGTYLYYSEEMLTRVYKKNPLFLQRLMLHQMLHCLFMHLWQRGDRNPGMWDLACDIAIENIIDGLNKKCVKRALSYIRIKVYETISKNSTAYGIYNLLESDPEAFGFGLPDLIKEFYTDDHSLWPKEGSENESFLQKDDAKKTWEKEGNKIRVSDTPGNENRDGGDGDYSSQVLKGLGRGKKEKSYRYFLRQFLSLNEKNGVSPDEFDMGYYFYGVSLYDNIPLIEPVEAYEDASIKELVIVIDTSYSTSGDLVRSFLEETSQILKEEGLWAGEGRVRILQCDDDVRDDRVFLAREFLAEDLISGALSEFELKGGGNTDFRPAFEYINGLIKKGDIPGDVGVLYFTDGKGIYPLTAPVYKTAFIFSGEHDSEGVPGWAIEMEI